MPDTGFQLPTNNQDRAISGGTVAWFALGNLLSDGPACRFDYDTVDTQSRGCGALDYDFSSIPAGAIIDGIEVRVVDMQQFDPSDADWTHVHLILEDDTDGTENKVSELLPPPLDDTQLTDEVGGPSDLWSETISRADVQDPDWGCFLGAIAAVSEVTSKLFVNTIQMKVYYSPAPSITDVDTDETWDDGDTGLIITGTGFV